MEYILELIREEIEKHNPVQLRPINVDKIHNSIFICDICDGSDCDDNDVLHEIIQCIQCRNILHMEIYSWIGWDITFEAMKLISNIEERFAICIVLLKAFDTLNIGFRNNFILFKKLVHYICPDFPWDLLV